MNEDQIAYLEHCIEEWNNFGNQETEWMEFDDFPQEFQDYIQLCQSSGLGWMDYSNGCDLLENFLECHRLGISPDQGWRFKFEVKTANLNYRLYPHQPYIWEYTAKVDEYQGYGYIDGKYQKLDIPVDEWLRMHRAYLEQFCSEIGEWKKIQDGWECSIKY